MKTNLKPISPWGSYMSMFGARIRLEKLMKMIRRSLYSMESNQAVIADIEYDLEHYQSDLLDIIDDVQHAAIKRYVEARNKREAAKKAKNGQIDKPGT